MSSFSPVSITAANWFASAAFYKASCGSDPDPAPNRGTVAAASIAIVTITCYLPFVVG